MKKKRKKERKQLRKQPKNEQTNNQTIKFFLSITVVKKNISFPPILSRDFLP